MRLKKVIIDGFRGFTNRKEIIIDELTAIIGKNDCGKSTILEALDIFFGNSSIEKADASVFREDRMVMIGCVFDNLPVEIIIDTTVRTSLHEEYLLNQDGDLEIIKKYNCNNGRPSESIFAIALHPTNENVRDILQLKRQELRALIQRLGITDNVDLNINRSMRQRIWSYYADDLNIRSVEVPLNSEDAKKIWEKILVHMPIYALFKSDRPSTDEDSEAQDPMKFAISEAIRSVAPQLEDIKEIVRTRALEVANRTIQKLNDFNTDLANELNPTFKSDPKWESLFKLTLTGDNQIPINKRGSGVRRLILLSFFRAEVERQLMTDNRQSVIYAIEEPETSQHPNFQRDIMNTLLEISQNNNTQVILSTHVPGLAGLLPIESIRYVYKNDNGGEVNNQPNNEVLEEIANSLGIIPTPRDNVKLLICVEGVNDVSFLRTISRKLNLENDTLPDLNTYQQAKLVALGGSNLVSWVENNYLGSLGLPECHIYDSDKDSPESNCNERYQRVCNAVNSRADGSSARMTLKREFENYIHPQAIYNSLAIEVEFGDYDDVPVLVSQLYSTAHPERPLNEKNIKNRLNNDVLQYMTVELLNEIDSNNEIEGWLRQIREYCNEH